MSDAPVTTDESPTRRAMVRQSMGWKRILVLMVAGFAIWIVLNATTLQHNAQVSPVGARRTLSLQILNPIAAMSRTLQISHIESIANGMLGRNGNVIGYGNVTVLGPTKKPAVKSKTSTTTTVPTAILPSATNPLRVLIVGDSIGIDLGDALQNQLASTGVVTATLDAKESTGLTRPDYFNWPAELQGDLAKVNPQVIVIMMGANDPQDFPGPPDVPFGTPQWNSLYEQKAVQLMTLATSSGAKVIWMSVPPMQDAGLNARVATVNTLQSEAAGQVKNVTYLDSASVIGNAQGLFTPFVTVDGKILNVREPDGTHVTPAGGAVLGSYAITTIQQKFKIPIP